MSEFEEDLERRISLLEDPNEEESILKNLPVRDVLYAVIGLVVMTVLLVLWAYGQ